MKKGIRKNGSQFKETIASVKQILKKGKKIEPMIRVSLKKIAAEVESFSSYSEDLLQEIKTLKAQIRAMEGEYENSYEAITESEERFTRIFEEAPTGMSITGIDGHFIHVNRRLCEMLGYSRQELTYKDFQAITYPDDVKASVECIPKLIEGKIKYFQLEKRYMHKNGNIVWVIMRTTLIRDKKGRSLYFITQMVDITQRKQAEMSLMESEEKFKNLAEESLVGIYLIQDGVFRYANPKMAEIFGYKVEELIGKKGPKDLTFSEDWHIANNHIKKRLSGEVKSVQYDFRGITKDGRIKDISVYGSKIFSKGKPAIVGTLLDMTEWKITRSAMAETEAKFRTLADTASDFIFIINSEGLLEYVNKAGLTIIRKKADYVIGKSQYEIFPEEIAKRHYENILMVFKNGKPIEREGEDKYGEKKIWISTSLAPIKDAKGKVKAVMGISRNISAYKGRELKLKNEIVNLKKKIARLQNKS